MDNHQSGKCPNCGQIVKEGFNFCPHCKRQLNSSAKTYEELTKLIGAVEKNSAQYKLYKKRMLIAISVVSMLAIVSFVIMISSAPEDKPGGMMTVSFSNVIENLEGNYMLSQTRNGQKVGGGVSAIITGCGMGEYKIDIKDKDYSSTPYFFSIGQNAVLNSSDIGIGEIKYTKNGKHNKINLEFKKDNIVWMFTKR